ncbi:protein of unknown function [Bradyrhizobium vignae]|uniref:Uncharacterized protein n=1 Tax=Bradyrhizobium vignae TaxID=1549949 RepID=A0A2U3QA14_9BRAD|nr:protein of unknown function [Bradyrhizobium vignae]
MAPAYLPNFVEAWSTDSRRMGPKSWMLCLFGGGGYLPTCSDTKSMAGLAELKASDKSVSIASMSELDSVIGFVESWRARHICTRSSRPA